MLSIIAAVPNAIFPSDFDIVNPNVKSAEIGRLARPGPATVAINIYPPAGIVEFAGKVYLLPALDPNNPLLPTPEDPYII